MVGVDHDQQRQRAALRGVTAVGVDEELVDRGQVGLGRGPGREQAVAENGVAVALEEGGCGGQQQGGEGAQREPARGAGREGAAEVQEMGATLGVLDEQLDQRPRAVPGVVVAGQLDRGGQALAQLGVALLDQGGQRLGVVAAQQRQEQTAHADQGRQPRDAEQRPAQYRVRQR
jgi:hypothetical protein